MLHRESGETVGSADKFSDSDADYEPEHPLRALALELCHGVIAEIRGADLGPGAPFTVALAWDARIVLQVAHALHGIASAHRTK
jgi:hypothetical protein